LKEGPRDVMIREEGEGDPPNWVKKYHLHCSRCGYN
jgi:hypothetical protein